MNYELKDKINITKELLSDLEMKSWQEIEYLQAQIANLTDTATGNKLRQLLKNLLTSYYVFAGGIESLSDLPIDAPAEEAALDDAEQNIEPEMAIDEPEDLALYNNPAEEAPETGGTDEVSDPFEYFVDFDDPIGEPLTDKDLYNN